MFIKIAAAEAVVPVAGAVLRDPDGSGQQGIEPPGAVPKPLGVDLPIQIVTGAVLPYTVTDGVDGGTGVVIQTDKIRILAHGELALA